MLAVSRVRHRSHATRGATAGNFVRERLGAGRPTASFIEQNARRCQSHTYTGAGVPTVVVATLPSIANWRVPATDPTRLLAAAVHCVQPCLRSEFPAHSVHDVGATRIHNRCCGSEILLMGSQILLMSPADVI